MTLQTSFVFVVCQVGAERLLKEELLRLKPDWHPAFTRPGLVTFKTKTPVGPEVYLDAVFARAHGASFGKAEPNEVVACAKSIPGSTYLHVFARLPETDTLATEQALRKSGAFVRGEPKIGAMVIDAIVTEPNELWLGAHVHAPTHAPWPGGRPELTAPKEAPSRAYLKMKEALLWSGAILAPGETVLELGSAPGGASLALLELGINVIGVDTADMAPSVLNYPGAARLSHLRKKAAALKAADLRVGIDWLALDVNLHPNDIFPALQKVVGFLPQLKGALLTFKLTDAKVARDLPRLTERVKTLGFSKVQARQLAYGHSEVFVFATSSSPPAARSKE